MRQFFFAQLTNWGIAVVLSKHSIWRANPQLSTLIQGSRVDVSSAANGVKQVPSSRGVARSNLHYLL
jgi:hypothetical protein